jgi:hypothetical protein
MEQSPSWEASRSSASQDSPHILQNLKVHYCLCNSLPPVHTLCQIYLVHAPHITSWRPILILFFHLCQGLPSGLVPSDFWTKTPYAVRATMTCLSLSPWFNHLNNVWWGLEIIKYTKSNYILMDYTVQLFMPEILNINDLIVCGILIKCNLNV